MLEVGGRDAGAGTMVDEENPMPAPRTLTLSPSARAELEHAARTDHRPYFRERCSALLKIAAGASVRQVAQYGLLRRRKPDTVADWLNRYEAQGLAGLVQLPRRCGTAWP
jgi:hypothetical protein